MSALKLSYYDNNKSANGSNYSLLKVVAKNGVIIRQSSNYYSFGSPMPGRSFSSNSYKYGVNGMLKDDEITGNSGTHYSAEFWEYDSRIGRRWNTDPVVYPWQSPYACFNNNPIYYKDPSGQEGDPPNKKIEVGRTKEYKPVGYVTAEVKVKPSILEKIGYWFKNIFNQHIAGLKMIGNALDNKVANFTKKLNNSHTGKKMQNWERNRDLEVDDNANLTSTPDKIEGEGVLNIDAQDEVKQPFIFGGQKDYDHDPTDPGDEHFDKISHNSSNPVLNQTADSIIEKRWSSHGVILNIKKPVKPIDNNHVDGIIQEGKYKGQTEHLINNNF